MDYTNIEILFVLRHHLKLDIETTKVVLKLYEADVKDKISVQTDHT